MFSVLNIGKFCVLLVCWCFLFNSSGVEILCEVRALNSAETVTFYKISKPRNQVELRYFMQCYKFCKPCWLSQALVDRVETQLNRLVHEGIFEPIPHYNWAAPIVLFLNPDSSIRICGDYKQTINRVSDSNNYHIPKREDSFASLGEKFKKLHLSYAYQQLILIPDIRSVLPINTHKELFQPTRLQFGIHAASKIFQSEIENLMKSVAFVKT